MCGIAGIVSSPGHTLDIDRVLKIPASLRHRGPDDWGITIGASPIQGLAIPGEISRFESPTQVALVNTRLSIVDLSPAGHQPMATEDGRFWISYNGEVYNFTELRAELIDRGVRLRSRSDTEVALYLYALDGVRSFARLNGMFAMAIWDSNRQELVLARDRFGIKPLYYAASPQEFVFGSELKTLVEYGVTSAISLSAVSNYLSFLWVPEPDTILRDVMKVPPAHYVRVTPTRLHDPEIQPFWQLNTSETADATEAELVDELQARLRAAVRRQTMGDVPVGAFLSGGLDSSGVVALMVQEGIAPASVHCIGFSSQDNQYERVSDDLRHARILARELGIKLEEHVLCSEDIRSLPKLIGCLGEPLADPAVIPLHLMCQAARSQTKVLLSGLGADELFGGYRRHHVGRMMRLVGRIPRSVRNRAAALAAWLPSGGRHALVAYSRRVQRLSRIAAADDEDRDLEACTWMDGRRKRAILSPQVLEQLDGIRDGERQRALLKACGLKDFLDRMLYLDTSMYLPSHNLNYTDKISMASSVEVRVPFLDNDVVDFAFRVPARWKLRGVRGKYLLRRAVDGVVPSQILRRGKTGFGAPIRSWITNDMRGLLEEALDRPSIVRRGLLDPGGVEQLLAEQRSGWTDHSYEIWALLTLELWFRACIDRRSL